MRPTNESDRITNTTKYFIKNRIGTREIEKEKGSDSNRNATALASREQLEFLIPDDGIDPFTSGVLRNRFGYHHHLHPTTTEPRRSRLAWKLLEQSAKLVLRLGTCSIRSPSSRSLARPARWSLAAATLPPRSRRAFR